MPVFADLGSCFCMNALLLSDIQAIVLGLKVPIGGPETCSGLVKPCLLLKHTDALGLLWF